MFQYVTTILKWNKFTKKHDSVQETFEIFKKVFPDKAEFMLRTWLGLDRDWDDFFQELNQENREKLLTYVLDH